MQRHCSQTTLNRRMNHYINANLLLDTVARLRILTTKFPSDLMCRWFFVRSYELAKTRQIGKTNFQGPLFLVNLGGSLFEATNLPKTTIWKNELPGALNSSVSNANSNSNVCAMHLCCRKSPKCGCFVFKVARDSCDVTHSLKQASIHTSHVHASKICTKYSLHFVQSTSTH